MTPRILLLALAVTAAACSSGDCATTTTGPQASTAGAAAGDDVTSTTGAPGTTTGSSAPVPSSTTPVIATADTTSPSSVTSNPTPSTTGPSEPGVDAELTEAELAERDLARTALVTLDDFPDGWVEDPTDDDSEGDPDEFENEFDACLGRDGEDLIGDRLQRIVAGTGDFHPADTDATQVSHEVVLAPDVETAIDRMVEVDITGAEDCVADVIGRFYETLARDEPDLDGIGIGDVVVTRTEREREPDLAVGILIEIPLTVDDRTVSQFLEFLYQRQGRALSELSFSSFGQPFSRDGYTVLSDQAVIGLATIGN